MSERISIQSRLDPRQLASLAEFLQTKELFANSRSHLITLLVELLYNSMLKKGQIREISSVFEADEIMTKMGMTSLFESEDNKKKMVSIEAALELELNREGVGQKDPKDLLEWVRSKHEGSKESEPESETPLQKGESEDGIGTS